MKTFLVLVLVLASHLCVGSTLKAEETVDKGPPKIFILDRPLIPTGYGMTKLLNKDYYLGRFAIDNTAVYRSPEDLVFIDAARQMEFKFVTERRISGATFARKLAESMKINNEVSALKANMEKIKRFKGFFKKSIKKGDILRIDYHPNFGIRVYLNSRMIGEMANSGELYRFILNTWLGDRPPSSKFKMGILGQNGDQYAIKLQTQYENM